MTTILVTLVVYKFILLGIGFFASGRTHSQEDLYLGGRTLGPLVAAISASASSSSVWTLLGVSGMAFYKGLSACWLFPACVGGFVLNWCLLAPRLRRHSAATGAVTLTDVLAGGARPGRRKIQILAAGITLVCLLLYVAAQLNGASKSFSQTLDMDPTLAILIGGAIVVVYMLLGGFWAVSLTDTLQGLVMAATSVLLPIGALVQVGGFGALVDKLRALDPDGGAYLSLTQGLPAVAGIGLVLGLVGLTPGYPGQPHVVNRFMALGNERDLRRARIYALTWAVLVYAGMILLGLAGRVLLKEMPADSEAMFFAVSEDLFPPVITGIMLAAVLSAIMSTADSQLLVAASAVNYDLAPAHDAATTSILRDRLVIFGLSLLAIVAAIYGEKKIFDAVLSAWTGLGAAFAPLLMWILWKGPVSVPASLLSMGVGFGSAAVAHIGRKLGWWDLYFCESRLLPYLLSILTLVFARQRWPEPTESPAAPDSTPS